MPELPEVETIVRRLAAVLPKRTVTSVEVHRDNVVRGPVAEFAGKLEGVRISGVERRAKFILIRLEGGGVWATHLRMSGKFRFVEPLSDASPSALEAAAIVADAAAPSKSEAPYVRATFTFDDGARLLYVDPRTLGEMEVVSEAVWKDKASTLGPEPLDPGFTAEALEARLDSTRRAVKPALLDQTRVAGLGNIYVAEVLWRARVSPRRRGTNVGPTRARRLHRAIVDVLTEAIGSHGTSLGETYLNYTDAGGDAGGFYASLAVYDREGEPCSRCGAAIRRIVQGQRSTWYCPGCQR